MIKTNIQIMLIQRNCKSCEERYDLYDKMQTNLSSHIAWLWEEIILDILPKFSSKLIRVQWMCSSTRCAVHSTSTLALSLHS